MNKLKFIFALLAIILFISACGKDYSIEQRAYINRVEQHRAEKNKMMKNNPSSPFNSRTKVEFHDLKYFDVDPDFVFKSRLFEYPQKDTITIFGTKGEARVAVRYGFLTFKYQNKSYKLNVYENDGGNGSKYYSVWFTDKTTNEDTYGVGRYLDFELSSDPDHVYTIDFNLAFNPYCAYSPDYSCAIPSKEDYIDMAVNAGEKKFHD